MTQEKGGVSRRKIFFYITLKSLQRLYVVTLKKISNLRFVPNCGPRPLGLIKKNRYRMMFYNVKL